VEPDQVLAVPLQQAQLDQLADRLVAPGAGGGVEQDGPREGLARREPGGGGQDGERGLAGSRLRPVSGRS